MIYINQIKKCYRNYKTNEMKNNYFEKLKDAMEEQQEDYDIERAYPIVEGIVCPPRNLNTVRTNCSIWHDFGFYNVDELTSEPQQITPTTNNLIKVAL